MRSRGTTRSKRGRNTALGGDRTRVRTSAGLGTAGGEKWTSQCTKTEYLIKSAPVSLRAARKRRRIPRPDRAMRFFPAKPDEDDPKVTPRGSRASLRPSPRRAGVSRAPTPRSRKSTHDLASSVPIHLPGARGAPRRPGAGRDDNPVAVVFFPPSPLPSGTTLPRGAKTRPPRVRPDPRPPPPGRVRLTVPRAASSLDPDPDALATRALRRVCLPRAPPRRVARGRDLHVDILLRQSSRRGHA